jgi:hypothetical protein
MHPRAIYTDVIRPLMEMWQHGSIRDSLAPACLVLTREVRTLRGGS